MSMWSRIERRLSEIAGDILPDEFRARLAEARRALEAGDAESAAALLEEALAERPDHGPALSMLGAARLELGQFAAALSCFDRALARSPDLAEAVLGRGQAQLALGDAEAAVAAFRASVDASGGDRDILAAAYRGLGLGYRRLGDTGKAVRELRKAVAENPEDAVARSALAEALFASTGGSVEESQRHARKVVEDGERAPLAWLTLGRIALDEGNDTDAEACFRRALEEIEEDDPDAMSLRTEALVGAGDATLARDPTAAHTAYLQALELAPSRAELHARLGEAHERVGNASAALACFERAADLGAGERAVRRGLDAALSSGELDTAVRFANRILDTAPDDPRALVARGVALARDGNAAAARATFNAALASGDDPEARVALGRLDLEDDTAREAGTGAAAHALAALRLAPSHARARELLAAARERELQPKSESADLYELLAGLQRIARHDATLAEHAGDVARAKADLDEPLLVTVMGEFSSGKSTFVNAFAGDDVAPTGITPTTATINVVKYGRERGGRIVHRHGAAEELGWQQLQERLRNLDAAAARDVELVEILLPLPALSSVHIVDTPGLNSILPEHEAVARDFITRADAVVWLFSAGQAGKASERRALEAIREQGVRVLGVLNKIDQLGEGEAEQLARYVESELGELVEAVLPVSAARARAAQIEGGDDGSWQALAAALESRFFAHARELKRQVCARRIGELLDRMQGTVDAELARASAAAEGMRGAAATLADARVAFPDEVVAPERRALAESVKDLYLRASREVLDLVQPRRLPFGSHSATPADRDYLLSLLDEGFDETLGPTRARVLAAVRDAGAGAVAAAAEARDVVGEGAAVALESALDDAVKWLDAETFGRARAFVRGYLRGGYVDRFFQRQLPKLELSEEAVHHALLRDSPDLDAAIAAPLASAADSAFAGLSEQIARLVGVADVAAFDLEVGLARALDHHRAALSRLTAEAG